MVSTWMMFLMGFAVFLNLFAIKWKVENERFADAGLDAAILVLIGWLFSSSIAGLMIGTIASSLMSLYLLISPPKLDMLEDM